MSVAEVEIDVADLAEDTPVEDTPADAALPAGDRSDPARTKGPKRRVVKTRKRQTKAEGLEGLEGSESRLPTNHWRPATRGECPVERPCPYVGCRHHLYLEVTAAGDLYFARPGVEVWDLAETCSLDVAEREGGATLDVVGAALDITRERVRQIELSALDHARRSLRRRTRAVQLIDVDRPTQEDEEWGCWAVRTAAEPEPQESARSQRAEAAAAGIVQAAIAAMGAWPEGEGEGERPTQAATVESSVAASQADEPAGQGTDQESEDERPRCAFFGCTEPVAPLMRRGRIFMRWGRYCRAHKAPSAKVRSDLARRRAERADQAERAEIPESDNCEGEGGRVSIEQVRICRHADCQEPVEARVSPGGHPFFCAAHKELYPMSNAATTEQRICAFFRCTNHVRQSTGTLPAVFCTEHHVPNAGRASKRARRAWELQQAAALDAQATAEPVDVERAGDEPEQVPPPRRESEAGEQFGQASKIESGAPEEPNDSPVLVDGRCSKHELIVRGNLRPQPCAGRGTPEVQVECITCGRLDLAYRAAQGRAVTDEQWRLRVFEEDLADGELRKLMELQQSLRAAAEDRLLTLRREAGDLSQTFVEAIDALTDAEIIQAARLKIMGLQDLASSAAERSALDAEILNDRRRAREILLGAVGRADGEVANAETLAQKAAGEIERLRDAGFVLQRQNDSLAADLAAARAERDGYRSQVERTRTETQGGSIVERSLRANYEMLQQKHAATEAELRQTSRALTLLVIETAGRRS